jgi:hypothetical protein
MVEESIPKTTFSQADLNRWLDEGLILQPQLDKILRFESAKGVIAWWGAEGINGPTILYYLGAAISMSVIGITFGPLAALIAAALGGWFTLACTPYRQAGSILITIATGLIPVALLYLLLVAGLDWNDSSRDGQLRWGSAIQITSLLVMVAIVVRTRIGMVALAVSVQSIALVWTVSAMLDADPASIGTLITFSSLGLIALGLAVRDVGRKEESFWFVFAGPLAFFGSATFLVLSEWHPFSAVLYFAVFAAFIALSAHLKSLMFLLSGSPG